jgi:hypothetical protein
LAWLFQAKISANYIIFEVQEAPEDKFGDAFA